MKGGTFENLRAIMQQTRQEIDAGFEGECNNVYIVEKIGNTYFDVANTTEYTLQDNFIISSDYPSRVSDMHQHLRDMSNVNDLDFNVLECKEVVGSVINDGQQSVKLLLFQAKIQQLLLTPSDDKEKQMLFKEGISVDVSVFKVDVFLQGVQKQVVLIQFPEKVIKFQVTYGVPREYFERNACTICDNLSLSRDDKKHIHFIVA